MAANAFKWIPDAVLDADQMTVLRSLVDQSFFETFSTHIKYYEKKLQRRPPVIHHYTGYCTLLKDTAERVRRCGCFQNTPCLQKNCSAELILKLNLRTWAVFRHALLFFKEDEEIWSIFMDFSQKFSYSNFFNEILDGAVLFYGHKLDKLYYYWMLRLSDTKLSKELDFSILTEMRYMYDLGIWNHQDSEFLLIESFKLELGVAFKLSRKRSCFGSYDNLDADVDLNRINTIFQVAKKNVHRHSNIFYQMFELTTWFTCTSKLEKTILQFLMSTPNKDPNYWDDLAKNELINNAYSKQLRLRNCIGKYKEGVLVVKTKEMWNKFIEFVFEQSLRLNMEPENLESDRFLIAKRILLKHCIWSIHKKKKYEPSHYIRWINQFNSYMAFKMIKCALERYPDNIKLLREILLKLMKINKLSASKLFKENAKKFNNAMWLYMVDGLSNEPCLKDILSMVFEDDSIYLDEVRSSLASKYLDWVYLNKSLDAVRYAYNELIKNSNCNKKLYKTMINIEMEQPIIDMIQIRQHFILACMQFGDIDNDLWTMRADFELKYGTKRTYFFVCYWASEILKEDNVKFSNILC